MQLIWKTLAWTSLVYTQHTRNSAVIHKITSVLKMSVVTARIAVDFTYVQSHSVSFVRRMNLRHWTETGSPNREVLPGLCVGCMGSLSGPGIKKKPPISSPPSSSCPSTPQILALLLSRFVPSPPLFHLPLSQPPLLCFDTSHPPLERSPKQWTLQ